MARVYPICDFGSYASVAAFNFLSTTCQVSWSTCVRRGSGAPQADLNPGAMAQYEALKYVSYTTASLAKCSKMVPVLVISAGLFKRKHQQKDWVAAGVIVTG
jgi:hypothetical protein